MERCAMDPENKRVYAARREEWSNKKEKTKLIEPNIENITVSGTIKMDLQMFAKIPEEKFTKYALNFSKAPDKATAFQKALGYTKDNASDLIENIKENIDESKFVEKGDNGFGMRYEYVMKLKGPNGKEANVLTSWIQDNDEKRLTSVYVTHKEATK